MVADIKNKIRGGSNPYDWVVDPYYLKKKESFKYAQITQEDKDKYMFLLQPNNLYNQIRLDHSSSNFQEIAFSLVGDTGDDNSVSKEVGKLLNFWRNPQKRPGMLTLPTLFNLLLGDNFYDTGFKNDNLFASCVAQTFGRDLEHLALLGNHDYNMWSWGQKPVDLTSPVPFNPNFDYGVNKGIGFRGFFKNLVGQRYHDSLRVLREVALTYSKTSPKWFLPNRYYTVRIPNYCVFIFIDSNRLLWDEAQQHWIYQTVQKIMNKNWHKDHYVMLVSHHPFVTLGKRKKNDEKQKEDDIKLYGDPNQIINVSQGKRFTKGTLGRANMELIKDLTPGGCVFDAVICAHDHFMESLIPNSGQRDYNFLIQITSGSGGHDVKIDPEGSQSKSRKIETASHGESFYPLPTPPDPLADAEAKRMGLFSQFYKGAGAFKMHMRPNRKGFYLQGMAAIRDPRNGGFYTTVIEPMNQRSYTESHLRRR